MCAFANDMPDHRQPGVVIIGQNDDGSCAGLAVTDQLLRTLSGWRGDGRIMPLPTMTVQKKTVSGCEIAAIVVEPADAPPVRFNGRIWIRVGPRRATASAEEERRLSEKRRAKDLPFDGRPLSSAALDDLDIDLFKRTYLPSAVAVDVLEQNQRTTEQQLVSTRFLSPDAPPTLTAVAILACGKDPRRSLPGAYVQFLRIDGTGLADPIKDEKAVDGPLPELLRRLEEVFEAHIASSPDFTSGPTEVRRADYPIVALQQIARNAVLHRTYEGTHTPVRITWFSDRIEIQSPGGPYGQVTVENFGQPGITDYRNPFIAEVMRNLGYVQRFGVGIALAKKEMEKNGNPPIEFIVQPEHVLVIIRRRP
jgi:ATP-dependent DNA helicase RecG